MSGPGIVTLASLRFQSQERSDQLNSTFLSTSEWNRNIMGSYKELYDLLISAYGNNYYVTTPLTFQTNGSAIFYPLPDGVTTFTDYVTGATITPAAFYKLLGVDIGTAPLTPPNSQAFITLRDFNFPERNQNSYPYVQTYYGSVPRYRIQGNQLFFDVIPQGGRTVRLWQVPRPSDIQPEVIGGVTATSTTITCTDTSNLSTGMYIQAPGQGTTPLFPAGTTISSITPNVSFVVSNAATATFPTMLIRCWFDSTTVDGISGYEEYIVIDAALKAMGKEEDEDSQMWQSKMMMIKRLNDMASNRDIGSSGTVSDTASTGLGYGMGFGYGIGYGGGY